MKTPVDNYEAAMYTALESMRAERWLDGFNSLEKVERLCRQYGFLEALPPVLTNQVIALKNLGREQALQQKWTELLALLERTDASNEQIRNLGPILHYFTEHSSRAYQGKELVAKLNLPVGDGVAPKLERSVGHAVTTYGLAAVHPAVIGASLAMRAAFLEEGASLRNWFEVLLKEFGTDEQPDAYLDLIALLDSTPRETVRIYRSLCELIKKPQEISPVVFFMAWLTAMRLEQEGLPKKLAFSPNPPQEQRVLYSLRLSGRLAEALNDVVGYEGFVHSIWTLVSADTEHLDRLIKERRSRGGKKSVDIEVFAEIACWRAMSALYFDQPAKAYEALAATADIARKQALNARAIAVKSLRLQAQVLERMGRTKEAALAYQRCLYLVFPKFDSDEHLQVFASGLSSLQVEHPITFEVMLGMAGWIRTSVESAHMLSEYVNDLLSLLPNELPYKLRCEGSAYLFLALAYHGDAEASKRAMVWSHASGRPGLKSIALAYRVLLDESLLGSGSVEDIQSELDIMESLPPSELRQSIQLLIAEAIFSRRIRALRPTAEMLIRRAGITICTPSFRSSGSPYLLLLPSTWQTSLWSIVDIAAELDLSTSMRPLLVSLERFGQSGLTPQFTRSLVSDLDRNAEIAVDGFLHSGNIDVDIAERMVELTNSATEVSQTRLPRLDRPRGKEAFLEAYQIADRWLFLIIESTGGALLVPNAILKANEFASWLGRAVRSHLKIGNRLYVPDAIPHSAVGFESFLKQENPIDVVYGVRPPSQRLRWNTSLSMLMIGDRWTSNELATLRTAAKDGISIQMLLDSEQYDAVTSAEWKNVDVVLLGVAATGPKTLSLWDQGGPLKVDEIAFTRGDNRNGLCVIVTPEQHMVHEQAIQLSEYFDAGVVVISASDQSLEVIGTLISRSTLLLEPVDVVTYLGKCYRELGEGMVDFCTLYTGRVEKD